MFGVNVFGRAGEAGWSDTMPDDDSAEGEAMRADDVPVLRDLLLGSPVLSLAVVVDGAPVIGLLPFAAEPGFEALLVHASRLARHAGGLSDRAPFAALVHADPGTAPDPLQVPRVTLEGRVETLGRGGEDWTAARGRYLDALPSAAVTFNLGDFELCRLVVERGRLVVGFARTANLRPEDLRLAAGVR